MDIDIGGIYAYNALDHYFGDQDHSFIELNAGEGELIGESFLVIKNNETGIHIIVCTGWIGWFGISL